MDDKTKAQVIILQVLSLAGMFLGRLFGGRVQTVIDLLVGLVQDHWEEIWPLTRKPAVKQRYGAVKKEMSDGLPTDDCSEEVRDMLERVKDEFGDGSEDNSEAEAKEGEAGGGKKKAGYRH